MNIICYFVSQGVDLCTIPLLATGQIADLAVVQNMVHCMQQCSARKRDGLCHLFLEGSQRRVLYELDAGVNPMQWRPFTNVSK